MKPKTPPLFLFLFLFPALLAAAAPDPILVGAMKDVMWGGRLEAAFDLDTVTDKSHLYGMGPVEFLAGEILVLDGKAFKSRVVGDTGIQVTETLSRPFSIRAPFFGYARIASWVESGLPDSVRTLGQLEGFLDRTTRNRARPFFFQVKAMADTAEFHVVNLPKGLKVASPEEAHQGQKRFGIGNTQVILLGFFSTGHKAVFTHHDTFLHIHLLTEDRRKMGHLESMVLEKGGKLLLPP
jgi:alpha-acetolactate decarboxylase